MSEVKEMQTEILAIREENVDEKFVAFIQVLDKDSASSSFLVFSSVPILTVTRKSDRLSAELQVD